MARACARPRSRSGWSAASSSISGCGRRRWSGRREPSVLVNSGGSSATVEVEHLTKIYRVHKRPPGLAAAMKSLLRRRYEEVRAVDDLSLSIAPGERVGFLGPNGAGKTTTLKVLSGLLHPTAGKVRVAGHVPQERQAAFLKRITLVMGQKQQLLWDLPPSETFALNRAVYDIPRVQFEETLEELTRLLEIGEVVGKPTRQLSLGERMKCELAAALLHRPEVLFLDEPTIGLDVSMQLTVREFVRRYNERFGATVMLTSHYMDDVAALCPRVVVIDQGKLRYDGGLAELVRTRRPEKRAVVGFERPVVRAELEESLGGMGRVVEHSDGKAVIQVRQSDLKAALAMVLARFPVADLTVEDPPLEEVMRELFAGEKPR
ncbi:MAG: ATP-binding cassette domain-containing protein [Myxococcales bacterium]|nr:ATP-binding cassette domain-containing protein [Myxococcales bacterium]